MPSNTPNATVEPKPLSSEESRKTDAYWRAANYLCVGRIYLHDNPLLREPLRIEHVKPRLLGHWGTPGLNFIYVHMNQCPKAHLCLATTRNYLAVSRVIAGCQGRRLYILREDCALSALCLLD